MPRRRYRLFTALAVVMLFMLYHVMQNTWDERTPAGDLRPPPENPVHPHAEHLKDSSANPEVLAEAKANPAQEPIKSAQEQEAAPATPDGHSGAATTEEKEAAAPLPESQDSPLKAHNGQEASVPDNEADLSGSIPEAGEADDQAATGKDATEEAGNSKDDTGKGIVDSEKNDAEKPMRPKNPPNKGDITPPSKKKGEHWKPVEEHFPVPSGSLISLPTGKPKAIPKIQYKFGPESDAAKTKRQQRQSKVKAEIVRSWAGYRENAWMHDELRPVSGRYKDPFCGWAATLVDSLDTLWIAGLKDEFDEAAKAVADIDFTYSEKSTIPVFETTIRYLGGLLSAFDVSGGHDGKYKILLDKAFELAEILMGIFDTPNRMPVLYYYWKPEYASQPHKAGAAGMAELATLSMEFTRLAQLTKENKYYDAIDRITNALIEFQESGLSAIPGLFPENFDASGCNRTATNIRDSLSAAAQEQYDSDEAKEPAEGFVPYEPPSNIKKPAPGLDVDAHLVRRSTEADDGTSSAPQSRERKIQARSPPPYKSDGTTAQSECVPQGLVPGGRWRQPYHMGGAQDSAYEYFPKEYLLLGGLEPKYKKLYEDTVEAVDEWLMYRPMIEDKEWDILFPAKLLTAGRVDSDLEYEFEITHLTCFIGGMYGLGGKAFGREKDVETAKKLTDGCVWAYQLTATGIMPETAHILPCPSLEKCDFNETLWWSALDPSKDWHDSQVAEWDLKYGSLAQTTMTSRDSASLEASIPSTDLTGVSEDLTGDLKEVASAKPASTEASANSLKKRAAAEKSTAIVREEKVGEPYSPDIADEDITASNDASGQQTMSSSSYSRKEIIPERPVTHEEYVKERIEQSELPPGFVRVQSKNYILRPEAIESVWYMYRITGDPSWMEKGWAMFEATIEATSTKLANSAITNVLNKKKSKMSDSMESFWIAESEVALQGFDEGRRRGLVRGDERLFRTWATPAASLN